mmetsp:Transcript_11756/g.8193  ORF Transcript_11756/g.8193 Transcript_11756/m.8193 type:complete len:211 (+) Transcript_11756:165-797(+)
MLNSPVITSRVNAGSRSSTLALPRNFFKGFAAFRSLNNSQLSVNYRPPTSKRYIFIAMIACLFFALSGIVRGLNSIYVFTTKFILSFAYLISSSVYFLFLRARAKRRNEVFHMPWYQERLGSFKHARSLFSGSNIDHDKHQQLVFNSHLFKILLIGGICEFIGSTLVIFSYKAALKANINQGICAALVTVNGMLVTVLSFIFYREKVTFL